MDELKKSKEVQSAFDLVNGLVFENHPHAHSDAAAEIVERNLLSTPPSQRTIVKITASTSYAAPTQHLRAVSVSRGEAHRSHHHTQTCHYMIEGWLEHGLLTTGEAIVFVRLDWRDSETLSFHLAEPSAEVEAYLKHADLRTAVAQYLAFGLSALGVPGERHECRHPP
ncbi:hypothetical protein CSAL01_12072 [Colletotrichum salicis]|uniref:Uncharacterized protein n=1 Tax=Colletotrichum salicis TaxID=1209931 RepID=A0A135UWL9_9PEZI|nr:hypothetical protein CSAL01_12072 [Colletotrichum salicis]